jgi:hypothetical protein
MKYCKWCSEKIADKRMKTYPKHNCPQIFIHRITQNKYRLKNNTAITIRGTNLDLKWIGRIIQINEQYIKDKEDKPQ